MPSYYLRYFYEHDAGGPAEQRAAGTRAEAVAAIENAAAGRCTRTRRVDTKPELLERARRRVLLRGGRRPGRLAARRPRRRPGRQRAQRRDAAVPARRRGGRGARRRRRAGAHPLPVDPLEPLYAGLIAHVTAYEDLALDAAVNGGRHRVENALLAHPLIGQLDLVDGLTTRLLAENAAFLAVRPRTLA